MFLSDISIKRPVFASVLSLLLIAFGIVSFSRMSLREYPDIDPPVVTISVNYPGAAASIVETRITQVIENRISGIEGIDFITSQSEDGASRVTVEFSLERDIDDAANDVRDRVAGAARSLPDEADAPQITKADSNNTVIVWYNLLSDTMTVPELSDYANRYLVEKFSVIDGVAQVRIGGEQKYAMRIWLDRNALAARQITVSDIESALRAENVELPAGSIESENLQFTIRLNRVFATERNFEDLVVKKGDDGYLVRLSDVARVERSVEENRVIFRGNGVPRVGIGITKQSTANTLDVAKASSKLVEELNKSLPEGMHISKSFDSSVFIDAAIHEVYLTLYIAIALVVLMIYIFLGNLRATIIPALTVPVSLIATFIVINAFGFSINILTLLALVLAIGIVVDDAIIVLENIVRRIKDFGETPLVAAYRGTRQVGFAVLSTTAVLISVFVPIVFLQGDLGKLFTEFSLTMAAAIFFSGLTSLSLSPMLASKFLKPQDKQSRFSNFVDNSFNKFRDAYVKILEKSLRKPLVVVAAFVMLLASCYGMFTLIPSEYTPAEDRGTFNISVTGPEGASFTYMQEYMDIIEQRLLDSPLMSEITTMIVRAPNSFGTVTSFNSGFVMVVLNDWGTRRPASVIMDDVRKLLADLPGVRTNVVMRQGFTSNSSRPVQFVIGGGTYEQLVEWRDIIVDKVATDPRGLLNLDWDYKETKPQFEIIIDYLRAAELGISVNQIGRTLETLMGSRKVTSYIDDGEEYDVIVEGDRSKQTSKSALENVYVRSERTGQLVPLSTLVTIEEFADAAKLNRFNRVRAITLEANLADDYTLGEALAYLEDIVSEHLPDEVIVDYKGQSQDYKESRGSMAFVFALGLLVVFLVLAAQFESYIHPFVIILTVPLAMAGGLLGLYVTGSSLNIYTQIGLLTLVGLAAKNGILIVEFANQMRDEGHDFYKSLIESAKLRLRPIIMTSLTAAAGAIPLIYSNGAGAETRSVIGIVIFSGVLSAMFFTIFVVPVAYSLLSKNTGSPHDVEKKLEEEEKLSPHK
jgi:multidrug efflux pump